jgi:uncharacterized OB-fold protein
MSIQEPFTIEQFYKFLMQGKLMAGKCLKCAKTHLPPRPLCDNCYSTEFQWLEVSGKGKLLTYTVIHVAPQQFQNLTPYAIGIIELENGLKIPGIIQDLTQEQLKIGMQLNVDFSTCSTPQQWPQWPRYCFKQA